MIVGDTLKKAAAQEVVSAPLSFDGVSNLIQDMRTMGKKPESIILSYHDRRALNQDTMGQSVEPVLLSDQNADDMQIAYVQGVMVGWNREIRRGQCMVVCKQEAA